MALQPLLKIHESYNWLRTPCKIVLSRVFYDDGDFNIDIAYKYELNGEKYTSYRYSFVPDSNKEYFFKDDVMINYYPGKMTTCYVNPAFPHEAVISQKFLLQWRSIIPLVIFIIVGLFAIINVFKKEKVKKARYKREVTSGELKQKTPPRQLAVGASIVSAVIGVGIFFMAKSFIESLNDGMPQYILLIVILGFGVCWGVITFLAVYFLSISFGPQAIIKLSNINPELGENIIIDWEINNHRFMRELTIFLKGEEGIRYYSSESENESYQTKINVFMLDEIISTTDAIKIRAGKTSYTIPLDTMHSFDGTGNKIMWYIVLRYDCKKWPQIFYEYPITIMSLAKALKTVNID
jgi:uncharacterized protein DUF3592